MTDLTHHSDDDSPLDPWTLESLLDGDEPAADDAGAPLAALIASTRRPGDAFELRGAADVLAAFRETSAVSEQVDPPTPRTAMLTTVTRSKLILCATAGALTLGAASAAAMAGTLPDGAQNIAHRLLKAPAAGQHDAVGPDATGPAAKGLCTAWTERQAAGETPNTKSVAFRNLATAAGGQDGIATYCATVLTPTSSPTSPTDTTTSSTTTGSTTTTTTSTTSTSTTATTEPTTSPTTPKGRQTTHPGQGAAQWTAHGRTATFPGKGASHWPKADRTKPGKGHQPTSSTTSTTASQSPTTTATSGD